MKFREIRTHEKISDRRQQASPGFDPDKRIVPKTKNEKEEQDEKVLFDPDRRV